MIVILLMLLLSPVSIFGYEHIWGTNFPSEDGYGYYGNELYLPTDEWSLDLRGVSLHNLSSPDWFMVENGVLWGRNFDCSIQLDDVGLGVIWKSRVIELDNNKTYYVDFQLETSDNWDISSTTCYNDFVRIGYYDDNQDFNLIYEKSGITERNKFSASFSNTSECQLLVEVDCSARSEIFKLYSINIYSDTDLGDNSELVITKLCSPGNLNYENRYIQITNISNHIIDLTAYSLNSIHRDNVTFTWELGGIILPTESLVIGDQDATELFCGIGKGSWSRKSSYWEGLPSNNDGAQLVRNDTRETTDRVVGINFYEGYTERKQSYLLASHETNSEGWDYHEINSVSDSNPGIYHLDETLPISLYNTHFSFSESGCLFNWTTYGESNLVGYNIFYSDQDILSGAVRLNPEIIFAKNSVQFNYYSFSLSELDSAGYLWLEVVSREETNNFSSPIPFNYSLPETAEVIEVVNPFEVTIFPNPSSSNSFIKVTNAVDKIKEIGVYNVKGQLVGKLSPSSSSDLYNIHQITDKLSSGIYFVSTKFETKTITKKLILTK